MRNKQTSRFPMPVPMPWMAAFNGPVVASVAHSIEAFAKGMESINGELSQFVGGRLREDARTLQACTACDTFDQLASLHSKWLSDAQAAYAAEASRLMELGRLMFNSAAKSAMEVSRNGYDIAQKMQAEAGNGK